MFTTGSALLHISTQNEMGMQKLIEIQTLTILAGKHPPRALGMVTEWTSQHQEEFAYGLGTCTSTPAAQSDQAIGINMLNMDIIAPNHFPIGTYSWSLRMA